MKTLIGHGATDFGWFHGLHATVYPVDHHLPAGSFPRNLLCTPHGVLFLSMHR